MPSSPSIHVVATSQCLAAYLATVLIKTGQQKLLNTICVVPTQRFALSTLRSVAGHTQSLIPPRMLTIDSLLDNLIEEAATLDGHSWDLPQLLDQRTAELMIQQLCSSGKYPLLASGHEHELYMLFAAASETSDPEQIFMRLIQVIKKDVYRSDDYRDHLLERMEQIQQLHKDFCELCQRESLATFDELQKQKISFVSSWIKSRDQHLLPRILCCGLTTLKTYYFELLLTLIEKNTMELIFARPPEIFSSFHPLKDLMTQLGANDTSEALVPLSRSSVPVYRCQSPIYEASKALELALSYVKKGVPSHQVGIILSHEGDYASYFAHLLPAIDAEVNFAASVPFSHSKLGLWISAFLRFTLDGEKLSDLLFLLFLKKEAPAADTDLFSLWEHGRSLSTLKNFLEAPLSSETKDRLQDFESKISFWSLEKEHTSQTYPLIDLTENFYLFVLSFWSFDTFSLQEEEDGIEAYAKESFESFCASLKKSYEATKSFYSKKDFLRLLRQKLLSEDIKRIGFPLKGIQIVSLQESRFVPFQVAIIVGCIEGKFPKSAPGDVLVDDWLKEQIGLRGWSYVEALEDNTFQLLYHRIPHLILTYADQEQQTPTVRSRFIEKLLSEGRGLLIPYAQIPDFLASKEADDHKKEQAVTIETSAPIVSIAKDLVEPLSASSMSYLLTCPYRFLLHRLGVEKKDPDEAVEAIEEGLLLHGVIEAFFTGYAFQKKYEQPLSKVIKTENLQDFFVFKLRSITDQIFSDRQKKEPLYFHLLYFSWPKFAEFIASLYEATLEGFVAKAQLFYHELSFGEGSQRVTSEALLLKDKRSVKVQGAIDHLQIFRDKEKFSYLLIDFKRKKVASASDVAESLAPQMVFYALCLEHMEEAGFNLSSASGLIGYYSILEGSWQPRGAGHLVKEDLVKQELCPSSVKDLKKQVQDLRHRLVNVLDNILVDQKPFTPQKGKHCEHCTYMGICRVEKQ